MGFARQIGAFPSIERWTAVNLNAASAEALHGDLYELRGTPAEFCELGVNLYYGCVVGCRYCYELFRRTTREQWTSCAAPPKYFA